MPKHYRLNENFALTANFVVAVVTSSICSKCSIQYKLLSSIIIIIIITNKTTPTNINHFTSENGDKEYKKVKRKQLSQIGNFFLLLLYYFFLTIIK